MAGLHSRDGLSPDGRKRCARPALMGARLMSVNHPQEPQKSALSDASGMTDHTRVCESV